MVKPQYPQCQKALPYRNPAAMTSYYLAVVSLLPLLGLPMGMAAFFLGIAGLRTIRQLPEAKGSVHALVGIIVGGGTTVVWLSLFFLATTRVRQFLDTIT